MRKFLAIWMLLCGLVLISCSAHDQTPVLESTKTNFIASPTPKDVFTRTVVAAPTILATPTSTPEAALATNGPYLIYLRTNGNGQENVLMDANGMGRKVFPIPAGMSDSHEISVDNISPNGKWLAFYTGSADTCLPQNGIPCNLILNLMNLETGQTDLIAPLLSENYPNNFVQAAQELGRPEITAASLQGAFLAGINRAFAWSPNGRYLAFAGQMDGLSSDLYVYDSSTKKLIRLSSGSQELQWISWSPDGKWIVHGSAYEMSMGMNYDVYAASLDGITVKYLSNAGLYDGIDRWLNSHEYFESYSENGAGTFGLRLVDIETGQIRKIWDGAFRGFSVDPKGTNVLLFAISPDKWPYDGNDPNFISGNYLINLVTSEKKLLFLAANDHLYFDIQFFGLGDRAFSVIDGESKQLSFLLADGSLLPTDLSNVKISVSPNQKHWISISEKEIQVFTKGDELLKNIPLPEPPSAKLGYDLFWSPDSAGLFLVSDSNMYSVDIQLGQSTLVETNLAGSWNKRLMWSVDQ